MTIDAARPARWRLGQITPDSLEYDMVTCTYRRKRDVRAAAGRDT
ncbi:hypothetical protein ACIA6C_28360 [Streptomyces sp. NPDC051578]